MTGPDLFQQADTPADPPTMMTAPRRRPRFGRRRIVIGSALLAVLVAGGSVVALLVPDDGAGGARAAFGGLPAEGNQQHAATAPQGGPAAGGGARGAGRQPLGDDTLLLGRLVSTGTGTLVVAQDNGPTRTVRTDDNTKVPRAGRKGLAALTPGDRVVVRVSGTGDAATAVVVRSPKAHVTGTVTALSGDTATLLRADGLSETVNVAALNPKPAVGDLVVVSGKADGTTVVAERSRALPKAS